MSLRRKNDARWLAAIALATSVAACHEAAPPITSEPRDAVHEVVKEPEPPQKQGDRASTFLFEQKEIGFKMNVAYPDGGHLCIIVPESAQDPMACMGVDASAMVEALPKGADRPFGVAYARVGDWSYFVMMSTLPADLEAREDIREFVGGAEKAVKEASNLTPKLVVDSAEQGFDLLRVKEVPVVRFRIDAPYTAEQPGYDTATTLYYAAYGAKAAMVTFLVSPKDIDKLMPFAEASVQTLELPARPSADRFGKPRAELVAAAPSTGKALAIFGPLVAAGVLLFWWLGTRKSDDKPSDEQGGDAMSAAIKKASKTDKSDDEE